MNDDEVLLPERADRAPYEVCVMLALVVSSLIYGVQILFGHLVLPTIDSRWAAFGACLTVLVGAVLTLVGSYYPDAGDVRLALQLGVLGQGVLVAALGYVTVHSLNDPATLPFTDAILLGLTAAALWRVYQMLIRLHAINAYVEAHRDKH